jgi:hypothetical protein
LFPENELGDLRDRCNKIQTAFVDEPRKAVEQADSLVASAMKRLAEVFAEERSKLQHPWDGGDKVSTEDLRVALQRYRTFFHRLLSVLRRRHKADYLVVNGSLDRWQSRKRVRY